MLSSVFLTAATLGIGLVGVNFLVSGFRTWRGSDDSYEMNRQISQSPLRTIFGSTALDEIDGEPRVEHGIAFHYDKKNDRAEVVEQSKLSAESIFETLR